MQRRDWTAGAAAAVFLLSAYGALRYVTAAPGTGLRPACERGGAVRAIPPESPAAARMLRKLDGERAEPSSEVR